MTTPQATHPLSRAALVMVLYVGLGAAGLVWAAVRGETLAWWLPGRADPQALASALVGVFMGLGLVFLSRLALQRFESVRAFHGELRTLLGPLPDSEILVLAGASSLGEEIFFRGALLPVVGLWWSSLIFALLHIPPRLRHWHWTFSSLVAGLLFGQLFMWSGDLSGPVLAHFIVNFLNLRHLRDNELR